MVNISTIFNNKIPNKTEIKRSFKTNKDYNLKLLHRLNQECMDLNDNNYYRSRVITHLFDYLNNNLEKRKIKDIEKIVYALLNINQTLMQRQSSSSIKTDEAYSCINHLKNDINILLLNISNNLNLDCDDLIRMTLFDKLMYDLFNKRKLKESVSTLMANVSIINYHNFSNETFDDILYREYERAKQSNNKGLIDYYIALIKNVVLVPDLDIDFEKYYAILRENVFENINYNKNISPIDEKINSFIFDEKKKRYKLLDEFTFAIDSDDTKKFDDAFSIDKIDDRFIIGVHIADVFSLGYDDKVVLEGKPFYSSAGYSAASLEKSKIKNTVSIFIQMNKDGIIEEYRIIPTKINVRYNMKYSELSSIVFSKDYSNTNFKYLDKTSQKLLLEKLSLLFDSYMLINNSNITARPNVDNFASAVVNKFMVLAGCIVSSYFLEEGYPYIYLNGNHNVNEFSMIHKGYDTGFSEYNSYGRVTSPIIDKASCISQILLYKCYFNNPSDRELGKYEKLLKPFEKSLNKRY